MILKNFYIFTEIYIFTSSVLYNGTAQTVIDSFQIFTGKIFNGSTTHLTTSQNVRWNGCPIYYYGLKSPTNHK